MSLPTSPRLAVLIDAENAYAAQVTHVLQLAATYGRPTVRRAYGDWTTPQLAPWKKLLTHLCIRPCQQFRYASGKNGSDCAMIMDAMDLLHSGSVEGFCIVSSDSDYTGLATRIREAGLLVYGFGQRHTVRAFAAACDCFTYLDAEDAAQNCAAVPEERARNVRRDARTGDVVLSTEPRASWAEFMSLRKELGPLPTDFLADREQGSETRDPLANWRE